jgi:hypothetical protein
MTSEKTEKIDLFEAYDNSPMTIVNQILASGKFAPAPEIPVREGETPIEKELTPLIKALYTAGVKLVEEHEALTDKKEAALSDEENGKDVDAIEVMYENQIAIIADAHKALNFLFLSSMRQHLGVPPNIRMALRKDYRAVMLKDGIGSSGSHMLSISLSDLPFLIGIPPGNPIDIFSGDSCERCSIYDSCNSPLKKPRN